MAEQGAHLTWISWDGATSEELSLRWENGAWVAEGTVVGPDVHYVARIGPDGSIRQFLLFRDLDEPDLWLVTDGHGRWAEMNGAERHDLRGCDGVVLAGSPMATWAAIGSLGLAIGDSGRCRTAVIDMETLAVDPIPYVYTRVDERRWRLTIEGSDFRTEFDVDEDGLALDAPGWFRRGPVALP